MTNEQEMKRVFIGMIVVGLGIMVTVLAPLALLVILIYKLL